MHFWSTNWSFCLDEYVLWDKARFYTVNTLFVHVSGIAKGCDIFLLVQVHKRALLWNLYLVFLSKPFYRLAIGIKWVFFRVTNKCSTILTEYRFCLPNYLQTASEFFLSRLECQVAFGKKNFDIYIIKFIAVNYKVFKNTVLLIVSYHLLWYETSALSGPVTCKKI